MKVTNGCIRATIDELDCSKWVDPKTGKTIAFMFEDEHTLVVDICDGKCPEEDCGNKKTIIKI
uniref:Uncharacterized protein n=1 Tax=viral metagenome TaxID=1070528 RepID=A0A6H1ZG92_9ZZZZ